MKNQFQEYYRLSEEEFKELWQKAIFVVDANFPLDLYRYSESTTQQLLGILKKLAEQNQLWIPHQVGLEYHENRLGVISKQANSYFDASRDINKIRDQFQSKKHPILQDEHLEKLQEVLTQIEDDLEEKQKFHENLINKDSILEELTSSHPETL